MKKGFIGIMPKFLLAFYLGIIMYIFFAVLHIEKLANFESAVMFELIGFILLCYFVLGNLVLERIKTGFFVPLVMVTIIYTIILDVINLVCVVTMPSVFFILVNFVLLFAYCMVVMPIYIMGKR